MGGHDFEPRFLYPTKLLLGQNNESFNMLRLRGFTAHIIQGEKKSLKDVLQRKQNVFKVNYYLCSWDYLCLLYLFVGNTIQWQAVVPYSAFSDAFW